MVPAAVGRLAQAMVVLARLKYLSSFLPQFLAFEKKVSIIIGLGGCEGRRKAMLEAGFGHAAGTGVPIDDLGRGSSPGAIAEEPVGRNVHFSCP